MWLKLKDPLETQPRSPPHPKKKDKEEAQWEVETLPFQVMQASANPRIISITKDMCSSGSGFRIMM